MGEPPLISGSAARHILVAALAETREAELLECLWAGGSATIDAFTERLVLVTAEQLASMWSASVEEARVMDEVMDDPEVCETCGVAHGFLRHPAVPVAEPEPSTLELGAVRSFFLQHLGEVHSEFCDKYLNDSDFPECDCEGPRLSVLIPPLVDRLRAAEAVCEAAEACGGGSEQISMNADQWATLAAWRALKDQS